MERKNHISKETHHNIYALPFTSNQFIYNLFKRALLCSVTEEKVHFFFIFPFYIIKIKSKRGDRVKISFFRFIDDKGNGRIYSKN